MIDKKYIYEYKGKKHGVNPAFVRKQNISDETLKQIIMLHKIRLRMHELVEKSDDKDELRTLSNSLIDLELNLQDLWGFDRDIRFYKFWNVSKCTCAKMDNEDMYPIGPYWYSGDCPLHGSDE